MMDMEAIRSRIFQARRRNQESRSGRRSPLMAEKSRVSRVLFDPPDHDENQRFVKRELDKAKREAEDRWNFDFENERPKSGRFEWYNPNDPIQDKPRLSLPTTAQKLEHPVSEKDSSSDPRNSYSPEPTTTAAAAIATSSSSPPQSPTTADPDPPPAAAATHQEPVCSTLSSADCDKTEASASIPSVSSSGSMKKVDPVIQGKPRSRLKQTTVSGHFSQRKRSRSKVKTQERKSDSEHEYQLADPSQDQQR